MAPDKILTSCAAVKAKAFEILDQMVVQGYRIDLWADGCADVHSPRGEYSIEHFVCSCPDATDTRRGGGSYTLPDGRRVCRHILAVMVVRPCQYCGRRMLLDVGSRYFECPGCGLTRDERIVKAEREAMRKMVEKAVAA